LLHPAFTQLNEPIPLRICVLSGEAVVSTDAGKTTLHGTLLSHPCLVTPVACAGVQQPHISPETREIIHYHALRYGLPTPFFPEGDAIRNTIGIQNQSFLQQPDLLPTVSLFGRESEWKTLLEAAEQARAGHSRSLVVVGEAGFGKTKLVQTLRNHLCQQNTWLWLEGNCRSLASSLAWYPLVAPLAQLSHCQPEWDKTTIHSHIVTWLKNHHPALAGQGELLFEQMLNSDCHHPESANQAPSPVQITAMVRFYATLLHATAQPTILFLDNLQWADANTLQLFTQLSEACNGSHLWLIGATRRSWLRMFPGSNILSTLSLSRLPLRTTHQLLKSLQPIFTGGDPLRRQMSQWSSGVPLFAMELLQQATRYAMPEQKNLTDLFPHTLLGLILDRLDTVSVHWRVVRAIAAYGQIRLSHLHLLDLHPAPTINAAVEYLVKIGLLGSNAINDEREIYFNNEMVRSAIWLTLLERDRFPD
ncbi:ATP-binding protein, partial [Candidatus Magnetaquicoccus inordinatus]|uniref:ATP-binding protein n=1 Tax=Candidatus Magnetaquicoccus inordinatus TaxID=2496818 RepID=UPI00102BEAB2